MVVSGDFLLVSIPNKQLPDDPGAKANTYSELEGLLRDSGEVFPFHLPTLRTGTLERLMQAADSLAKVDMNLEQVIRKIERQIQELEAEGAKMLLSVEDQPVLQYMETFKWNAAKYPTGRQVDELAKGIVQQGVKLEDELKESALYLQEKKTMFTTAQRKKEGNLTIVDLNTVITPEVLAQAQVRDLGDSEYLKDVVVIVPKALEEKFLTEYEELACEMVGYGEHGDREAIKGSPVVPGSAVKLAEDNEGYKLFVVKILKGFFDEFKRACMGNRFVVREYDFASSTPTEKEKEKEVPISTSYQSIETEYRQAELQLKRWCSSHYGEAFMSWMHIKAIRVFVESCLRYGIPANFAAVMIRPRSKTDKKVRAALQEAYGSLDSSGLMQATKEELGSGALTDEQIYPYVSFDVSAFGANE